MKAVRVHRYGEPPRLDDVAEPTVGSPQDVVVRVGAAGLCRTDLHVLEGQWKEIQHPPLPYTLGHETRAGSRTSAARSPGLPRATR